MSSTDFHLMRTLGEMLEEGGFMKITGAQIEFASIPMLVSTKTELAGTFKLHSISHTETLILAYDNEGNPFIKFFDGSEDIEAIGLNEAGFTKIDDDGTNLLATMVEQFRRLTSGEEKIVDHIANSVEATLDYSTFLQGQDFACLAGAKYTSSDGTELEIRNDISNAMRFKVIEISNSYTITIAFNKKGIPYIRLLQELDIETLTDAGFIDNSDMSCPFIDIEEPGEYNLGYLDQMHKIKYVGSTNYYNNITSLSNLISAINEND